MQSDELAKENARLQAEVRQLRQHKNDYMEAAEETRKALQAEVERLKEGKALVEIAASQVVKAKESLQSELTKARELFQESRHIIASEVQRLKTMEANFPKGFCATEAVAILDRYDAFLSSQSAPAECGACPGCADGCQLDRESPPANGVA